MGNDIIKDYPPYLDYPKPRKASTNADRIRAMTDEELKEWFCNAHPYTCSGCPFDAIKCSMLDWLREEANE